MTGEELRELFMTTLDPALLGGLVEEYGVQQRDRKLNVTELLIALILTGGTHEGGRQYDVLRTYLENTSTKVKRSAFYSWFTEPLERVLTVLLARAIAAGQRQQKLLPGILGGVGDWRIVDATTVRLRGELVDTYPGPGDCAALKVHKEWSVGTGNLYAYKITPARDHDSPHLVVDEARSGTGLIADLAYVSLQRLAACDEHDVRYVVRLEDDWKPTVDRLVRGTGFPDRVRWEIEIDNKIDKAGARMDELEARKPVSARILVLASMLNAAIAKTIIQSESVAIVAAKKRPTDPAGRGPLHPISLMRWMASSQPTIVRLLLAEGEEIFDWRKLMSLFRDYAADTSWRRRPSVLDVIQGLTAPMIKPPPKKAAKPA